MAPAREHLSIWCNFPFYEDLQDELRARIAPHHLTLVDASVSAPTPGEAAPQILLGQPDADYLLNHQPRWVEITSAGYTAYDREDLREKFHARGATLTNTSSVFDEACAQHLLAMILALARELPRCLDNQRDGRDWLHDETRRGRRFLLNGQTAILYGFGAIARRLVELLRPLGMELIGVRRQARGDEGILIVRPEEANELLAQADHVIDILPAKDATAHFFDSARFACCKTGARFYNIGRGTTVDQDALMEALRSRQLDAAYLDVTDPEPLPPEHPLWDAPHCFITPHIAGTHDREQARLLDHFLENLAAFESGAALIDRVF
jgi:phosphoglycerate dehydrogenase-like enzyme